MFFFLLNFHFFQTERKCYKIFNKWVIFPAASWNQNQAADVWTHPGRVFQALSLPEDLQPFVVNGGFQLFVAAAEAGLHVVLRNHCKHAQRR